MPTRTPFIATDLASLHMYIQDEIDAHGTECDLNHIDVSQMESLGGVFKDLKFRGDISKWNVSNVKNFTEMFHRSAFDGDISAWDFSSATDATHMFKSSRFTGDISNWNTSSLVHATGMFKSSRFNGDLSRWDTSNVASMAEMFQGAQFNGDISNWNVDSLSNCSAMFAFGVFNGNLSKWDFTQFGRYCNLAEMFQANEVFAGDLSHWKLNDGSHCKAMFSASFRGILPRQASPALTAFSFYAHLFDQEESFQKYLAETPFGLVHAEVLSASAVVPPWFPREDFPWLKEVMAVARGIGIELDTVAPHVLAKYRERKGQTVPSESWDMGSEALAPETR